MNRDSLKPAMFVLACLASMTVSGADSRDTARSDYINWESTGSAINEPLGGLAGDAVAGGKLVVDRKKGNCIACHMLPATDAEFPGNVGPPLFAIGSRLSEGEIRLRVVDIKQLFPGSIMPGYYRNPENFIDVKKKFRGKTVLTAQEVEDVVAWLKAQK